MAVDITCTSASYREGIAATLPFNCTRHMFIYVNSSTIRRQLRAYIYIYIYTYSCTHPRGQPAVDSSCPVARCCYLPIPRARTGAMM